MDLFSLKGTDLKESVTHVFAHTFPQEITDNYICTSATLFSDKKFNGLYKLEVVNLNETTLVVDNTQIISKPIIVDMFDVYDGDDVLFNYQCTIDLISDNIQLNPDNICMLPQLKIQKINKTNLYNVQLQLSAVLQP